MCAGGIGHLGQRVRRGQRKRGRDDRDGHRDRARSVKLRLHAERYRRRHRGQRLHAHRTVHRHHVSGTGQRNRSPAAASTGGSGGDLQPRRFRCRRRRTRFISTLRPTIHGHQRDANGSGRRRLVSDRGRQRRRLRQHRRVLDRRGTIRTRPSFEMPKDLSYSKVYYWHVRASDPTTPGPWSARRRSQVTDPPAPVPSAGGQDGIDLRGVTVSPADRRRTSGTGRSTARITALDFQSSGVDGRASRKRMARDAGLTSRHRAGAARSSTRCGWS